MAVPKVSIKLRNGRRVTLEEYQALKPPSQPKPKAG